MAPAPPPPGGGSGVPVELSADRARELAARELADPAYLAAQPGIVERGFRWLLERLSDVAAFLIGDRAPGAGGLLVLALVVLAVVVVVRWRMGPGRRTARVGSVSLDAVGVTADDHRHRGDEHAAAGRHDEAVREWMRALVRGLEERDLLTARTGRTAGEAAAEAAAALPDAAGPVRDAARCFDETVYGGRPADAAAVDRMRAADAAVRATRPVAA